MKNRFLRSLITGKRHAILASRFHYKECYSENNHIFFGYYDVSPFNDNDLMLACKVENGKEQMSVGFFDLKSENYNDFVRLEETKTWCWQMGCRLQWLGENNDIIIYNDFDKNEYCSYIIELDGNHTKEKLRMPVYGVNKSGTKALSLNFSRLERLRPGYGYSILKDISGNDLAPFDDGIFLLDIENNKSNFVLSIGEISEFDKKDSMVNASHYFNHLSFNPSSTHFLFFHCWIKDGSKLVRIFLSDLSGSDIQLICDENKIFSHFNWISDSELICYLGNGNEGRGYYLFDINSNNLKKIVDFRYNDYDGHPTQIEDLIITDTVADRFSERRLVKYSLSDKKNTLISKFFSHTSFKGPNRCDLHPRLNKDNTKICVDSSHRGYRTMSIFNIG